MCDIVCHKANKRPIYLSICCFVKQNSKKLFYCVYIYLALSYSRRLFNFEMPSSIKTQAVAPHIASHDPVISNSVNWPSAYSGLIDQIANPTELQQSKWCATWNLLSIESSHRDDEASYWAIHSIIDCSSFRKSGSALVLS